MHSDSHTARRIIDANFNRVTEGLRVVEDYLRFGSGDRFLTERTKKLRHDIASAVVSLGELPLLTARDTPGDIGTSVTTAQEGERASFADIIDANWQRVQQGLRTMEEYVKLLDPAVAARLEALRYESYTLAKATALGRHAVARLQHARLYVLTPGMSSGDDFTALMRELISVGVDLIQLRDHALDDRVLLARARILRSLTKGSQTLFIMNDRPDLAVLCGADGVHVGQEELTVGDVRRIVGPEMLVGVSTHSLDQARQAVLDGASYIGCGPVFTSSTKHFADFPGLPFLRQVAAEIALPAFAIGGIHDDNLHDVLATGCYRIAVSGGVISSSRPGEAARALKAKLLGTTH